MKKMVMTAVALLMATAVNAQVETDHGAYREIATSGDWTTIQFKIDDRDVCAIFSRPEESRITQDGEVISALRGERAAFITWEEGRVDENGGVFSALVGAPLADEVTGHAFETEKGSFDLFGYQDRLFAKAEEDVDAIDAIRRGLKLTLTATLPGDRVATDVYSLRGVMKATELAAEACGGV